ncbi:MAG: 5-methyltetrahydropteroyltriglutamate--homocysteine S-methyltransferase, partial [Rubrivivax sp.]|nr:5-methyltetrahydropteroyltriglutamate--homocysteine S-methyltransferase [Rubrivivax sp.]
MAPAPILTHALGYPRMGESRELKFALEKFWRGEMDGPALEAAGRQLRARSWQAQKEAGLDFVTVGDFAYYDHMLNHIQLLGCEPARFGFSREDELTRHFTMARGQVGAHEAGCGCGSHGAFALEMTKWFDTNYHYLVPEFHPDTTFRLNSERLFREVAEAQALGHRVKAVLVGPLTFLHLGKAKAERLSAHAFPLPTPLPEGEGVKPFNRLDLLEKLLPVYGELLARLKQQGVEWVQIDEPILGLDLPDAWRKAFEPAYNRLNAAGARLLLATYFSPLQENLSLACKLPVAGLHVDAVRAPDELAQVA